MNFRTQIPQRKASNQIDYTNSITLFGSCFSENIGGKFDYFKFQNSTNPFGILFHPIAIEKLIENSINQKKYTENDVFFHNERWHCFDAHSELSNASKKELLQNLNTAIQTTYQSINETSYLVITLGTAWIYRFIETDLIIANCHKIPQKKFLKELLSIGKIVASLETIVSSLKRINPKIEIIFTVSPVRHLKDGFIENAQSKAHLLSAIHQVVMPKNQTHYFPSYEIMIDDLRDYRFYKSDMIHPNKTAIEYIWQQFKNTWIDEKTNAIMTEVEVIQKGLSHKPFHENSEKHQQFLKNLHLKMDKLRVKYNILF